MLHGVGLITGAGGTGIGAAIARAFVKAGCRRLAITDVNPKSLSSTADQLRALADTNRQGNGTGGSLDVLAVSGDISSSKFVDELFGNIKTKFGRLDYAVNCAGVISNGKTTDESSLEDFNRITDVNYRGVWLCSRKELQVMKAQRMDHTGGDHSASSIRRQRGAIVNIASQLGMVGRPGASIYCASKSAVIALTRCDAIDASPWKIRVNALSPGWVDTPMTVAMGSEPETTASAAGTAKSAVKTAEEAEGGTAKIASLEGDLIIPNTLSAQQAIETSTMKRAGTPEEIADVCVFLCSEKASFVQGANWVVDGGYTIH